MMERRDLLNNKTIKDCRLICSHAQTSGNVDEHMNWKFIYIMISTWAAQRDKTLGDNDDMSSFWITDYTQNWKVYIHVTFSPKRQNEIIFDNLLGHLLVDYEKIFIAFFYPQNWRKISLLLFFSSMLYRFSLQQFNFVFFSLLSIS